MFLGSTIGNLTPGPRAEFLATLAAVMRPGDSLLLGTDLVKDTGRLVRAYDDAAGVTARFNRNVLAVINRELDADFDVDAYRHVARWNTEEERIEMWLRSERAQRVRINALELTVEFAAGEEMLTEVSCKFRPDGVRCRIGRGGTASHSVVDRQCRRFRAVVGRQVSDSDSLADRWRAARPPVAGLHLDSAACSRQSLAVIDAAAQHARYEAEVGGYVAAEAADTRARRRTRRVRRVGGMPDAEVVFTTGSLNALDLLLGSWPADRRKVACLPGEYGPNLAAVGGPRIRASAAADAGGRPVGSGRRGVRAGRATRPIWSI